VHAISLSIAVGLIFSAFTACAPGQNPVVRTLPNTLQQSLAKSFAYTGAPQVYVAPAGVTQLVVTLNGGAGGYNDNPYVAAQAAQLAAKLTVSAGQILLIYVGQIGGSSPEGNVLSYQGTNPGGLSSGGGFVGGTGGDGVPAGGGGGGATVVSDYTSGTVLLAAGGGGGQAGVNYDSIGVLLGGAGGQPNGQSGESTGPVDSGTQMSGSGATTSAPGVGGPLGCYCGIGSSMVGGAGSSGSSTNVAGSGGGGGGGGYYGGGGGGYDGFSGVAGPGGGGSSYAAPNVTAGVTYSLAPLGVPGSALFGDGSATITPS